MAMDLQSPNDDIVQQRTLASMEEKLLKSRQRRSHPEPHTICPFPDSLIKVHDEIRWPQLTSFGPCRHRTHRFRPFEDRKWDLLDEFLTRTEKNWQFYYERLMNSTDQIKRCYSEEVDKPADDHELVKMMLLDGSFMVELFLQYEEGKDFTPPPTWSVQTLIADLLKLENQLPFFVLENLFELSTVGPPIRSLSYLALRFLSQAFRKSPEMVKAQVRKPKHLLDLFRRSLLPATNLDEDSHLSKHDRPMHPIQSVKHLRTAGISVRQRTAKSLLEIDFKKFQIPPLALKIPPLAIDDFTNAILVNCVAVEQCFTDESKHFTAYVYFMSCLMKEPEDVGYLRSADIINGFSRDEESFINMLNGIGTKVGSTLRECYLCKQFREIHCYYNSYWASISRSFFQYDHIMLYCSLLQIIVSIVGWRVSGN
ncbi:hypothetical protein Golax_000991 [Gossypium laxum]|uniref:Uncharacterized protein n=1 Tax=Gossypium laxum TaxID=34288 RepID=A0A7J9AVB9_9ROSI|nr:hypothetical protein [Gossypium laxum]